MSALPMWYNQPADYQGAVAIGPPPPLPAGDSGGTHKLPVSGVQRLQTTSAKAPETGSGWANFSKGLKEVTSALAPVAQTGLQYQAARDERKLAAQQAAMAEERAAAQRRLAEQRLQIAQQQQAAALQPQQKGGISGKTLLIGGGIAAAAVAAVALAK